jgi:hypothetical protein
MHMLALTQVTGVIRIQLPRHGGLYRVIRSVISRHRMVPLERVGAEGLLLFDVDAGQGDALATTFADEVLPPFQMRGVVHFERTFVEEHL